MEINLREMSLKELKQLQKDVNHAIATYKDRQREEALQELEELARQRGFSLVELTGSLKKRRKPVAPKYANPANPDMTWSGRGRQPRWVSDALSEGRTLEDLAIRE